MLIENCQWKCADNTNYDLKPQIYSKADSLALETKAKYQKSFSFKAKDQANFMSHALKCASPQNL